MFQNPPDEVIRKILTEDRTIAVVGCSAKEWRDSHRIAALLIEKGHRVLPVNPHHTEIFGLPCYRDLHSIPESVDMVDVFRRPEFVPDVAAQAIAIGAKILWLQLGVIHEEAAQKAKDAGLIVVMDKCPAIEYRRLGI